MKSALLGMVVLGLLSNTSVTVNGQPWLTETVDTGFFRSPSIAVDSLTRAHISYVEVDNQDLKYATNVSGSWVISTVDSAGDVGRQSSIAVDASDKIHICFRDIATTDLKHTTNASGSWVTTTVDLTGVGPSDFFGSEEGAFNSIAVDSSDKIHISYRDLATTDLKYATNASGSWVITTVDFAPGWSVEDGFLVSVTGYTSIAVDDVDKVHIGCIGEQGLAYTTNASGPWVTETVDSDGKFDASIAVDSLGNVHIMYYDAEAYGYAYATNASGSWEKTAVDSANGGFASIALDGSDGVHLCYVRVIPFWPSDTVVAFLLHATNTSGSWVTGPVDLMRTQILSGGLSMAVDGSDKVHIGYLYYDPDYDDGLSAHIMYATTKGCFVGTAVFGTDMEPRLEPLRAFRDRWLMKTSAGRAFVTGYYKYSPPLADYIAERGWMRILVRNMLLPIIGFLSLIV